MNKVELLKNVSIFNGLSGDELGYISKKMVPKSYDVGQVIILEESEGDDCFFVTEGSVKITRLSKDGREVILAILNEGEFFGEMALLDGDLRSANVIALEKTDALTLKRKDFIDSLKKYPQIAIQLLKEMAHRLRESDRQITSLSLSDAEKRIALSLLRISDEQGVIKKGKVIISKPPIQQDIANMAGTSRETVSRTLKILEDERFIDRNGHELVIIDYKRFKEEFGS
ncbi:MAG: Crp/Fnr family transcriptional regulator [Candidatus Neomarinimicrobiota bacterium]|nr:Crp/Fnr family transcriptional regulator [Candidatus Neomarinimicrobiota bacterium]